MAEYSSLISVLLPLFMSLVEAKKERQREAMALEVRRLEAQIKNDRDKLDWEKEKTILTINSQLSLQEATNKGLIDREIVGNFGKKEVAEIQERTQNATNASTKEWQIYHADASKENAKVAAEGKLSEEMLKASHTKVKNKEGEETSTFDPVSFGKIQKALGRTPVAPAGGESSVAGNASQIGRIWTGQLQSTEILEGKAARDAQFTSFPKPIQDAVLEYSKTLNYGTTLPAPDDSSVSSAKRNSPIPPVDMAENPRNRNVSTVPTIEKAPGALPVTPGVFRRAGTLAGEFVNYQIDQARQADERRKATEESVKNIPETVANAGRTALNAVESASSDFAAGFAAAEAARKKREEEALKATKTINAIR